MGDAVGKFLFFGVLFLVAFVIYRSIALQFFDKGPVPEHPDSPPGLELSEHLDGLRSDKIEDRWSAMSAITEKVNLRDPGGSGSFTKEESDYVLGVIIPELKSNIESSNLEERVSALATLAILMQKVSSDDDELEAYLLDILSDSERDVRERLYALDSLSDLKPLRAETVDGLLLALAVEPTEFGKSLIARLLVESVAEYPDLKNELFAVLRDGDDTEQRAALRAFGLVPGADDEIVDEVMARLEDSDPQVRHRALVAMRRLEFASRATVEHGEALVSLIYDSSELLDNRTMAIAVLSRLAFTKRTSEHVDTLRQIVENGEMPLEVRSRALRSLPFASHHSPDLIPFLSEYAAEPGLSAAASWAIRKIEDDRQLVLEAIRSRN